MQRYTVKQLARVSGVSVRTLHHYDEIGLLKPAQVSANRYRSYTRAELLRLQQILFHRELGFPSTGSGRTETSFPFEEGVSHGLFRRDDEHFDVVRSVSGS